MFLSLSHNFGFEDPNTDYRRKKPQKSKSKHEEPRTKWNTNLGPAPEDRFNKA